MINLLLLQSSKFSTQIQFQDTRVDDAEDDGWCQDEQKAQQRVLDTALCLLIACDTAAAGHELGAGDHNHDDGEDRAGADEDLIERIHEIAEALRLGKRLYLGEMCERNESSTDCRCLRECKHRDKQNRKQRALHHHRFKFYSSHTHSLQAEEAARTLAERDRKVGTR